MPKPPLLGKTPPAGGGGTQVPKGDSGIERSEDVGEVVQSSTCVIPLTLKASFVQPLSLASARQLSWQESPWQRGFVFDETDLCLPENVTECQSLSLWERCLRSRRRGQGCCKRARHTAIRTLLVRAIVSQRRWSNFTGLALSDACGASSPKVGALGKEVSFSRKLICVCRKTSRNAKASPTRKDSPGRGRWHASAERGQWHRAKRR